MTTETEAPVNVEADAPASTEDRRIWLDPDDLHGSFARALTERPELRQAASTVIGTRVKRQADARIKELEAQIEALSIGQQRSRFESMDEDELAAALRDPNVAAAYAEAKTKKAPDPDQIKQVNAVELAVEEALDDLRDIGAPPERIETWKAYLRDQNAPFDRSSPAAFIRSVQRAIDMEVHTPADQRFEKYGYGKAPAPKEEDEGKQPETPAVAANPRLARGAPDTSRPDGGGKRPRFSTFVEASVALQEDLREGRKTQQQVTAELRHARQNLPYS